MREENTIGKDSDKPDENAEDSGDAASQSDLNQKKLEKIVATKQEASKEEITATVRIKGIRGSTSAEKKKKE